MFAGVELLKRVAKRDDRVYVLGGTNPVIISLSGYFPLLIVLKVCSFYNHSYKNHIVVWSLRFLFVGTGLTG